MLDQGATIMHQRVRGQAEVAMSRRGGATRLDRLRQSGSAKAMLPNVHGGWPEIVFLNTAGGLTGGDRLDYRLDLGEEARAVATTQTAERIYDGGGGVSEVDARFTVGARGRLDWLPQETILFDASALRRRTRIDLGRGAACLTVETLVLGRRAMGETLREVCLSDRREIWREGVPVVIEPREIGTRHLSPRPALSRGAVALGSLTFVADGAEAAADALAGIEVDGVEWGASGWDGRTTLRAFAADALPLRRLFACVLERLRGVPPPRVWPA